MLSEHVTNRTAATSTDGNVLKWEKYGIAKLNKFESLSRFFRQIKKYFLEIIASLSVDNSRSFFFVMFSDCVYTLHSRGSAEKFFTFHSIHSLHHHDDDIIELQARKVFSLIFLLLLSIPPPRPSLHTHLIFSSNITSTARQASHHRPSITSS